MVTKISEDSIFVLNMKAIEDVTIKGKVFKKIDTEIGSRVFEVIYESDKVSLLNFHKYIYDKDYIIIGQNLLGFDVYIHRIYCKYLGIKPDYSYISRIYDTNCIAKAIKKDLQPPKDLELIYWQYKLPFP